MRVLDNGRIEVAAMCLGIAQAALRCERDVGRSSGGSAASHWRSIKGIQWMLADMATELRAARLLTEDAARKRGAQARYSLEASMAKLFASEAAGRIADRALQIHGGYGYTAATCRSSATSGTCAS